MSASHAHSVSLETWISLRQSQLGIANWIPNLHFHLPPKGNVHLIQKCNNPAPTRPMSLRKSWLHPDPRRWPWMTTIGFDWFRNPGYVNQGMTGHANGQFRLRQQRGSFLGGCREGSCLCLRDGDWTWASLLLWTLWPQELLLPLCLQGNDEESLRTKSLSSAMPKGHPTSKLPVKWANAFLSLLFKPVWVRISVMCEWKFTNW